MEVVQEDADSQNAKLESLLKWIAFIAEELDGLHRNIRGAILPRDLVVQEIAKQKFPDQRAVTKRSKFRRPDGHSP